MPRTDPNVHDADLHEPVFRSFLSARTRTLYRNLWLALRRQREALIHEAALDGLRLCDSGLFSDLLDQAAVDREQELSLLSRARSRAKLRQIDAALQRMDQHVYGLCVRCGHEIPFARLIVQPAALSCVACQAQEERKYSTKRNVDLPGDHDASENL